jgi:hypothetical protein
MHASNVAEGLRALEPLVGEWRLKASIGGQPIGSGRVSFRWIEDGAFLLQRADREPPPPGAPSEWVEGSPEPVVTVIGLDESTGQFTMLYADARGVSRVYRMSLSGGEWSIWRNAPGFSQRFAGLFAEDLSTIVGRWEWSEDGVSWQTDFDLTYIRKLPAP